MDAVAKCPLETGELSQKRALVPKKRLERNRTRLSVLEKDIRQEVASDATTESETEVVPRRQNTLTDKAALRRRLRANRMSNDASTSGMSLPQHGNSRTSDPTECNPGEVRGVGGAPRK